MALFAALALLASTSAAPASAPVAVPAPISAAYRQRLPQDEVIYFVMPDRFDNADPRNDRGGLKGGRLVTGYDPTSKGFYHGGDLKGLIRRLDYIQGLGTTAVWLTPVFVNQPVQGPKGQESSGYHGYWVTDFTRVDPHLGSNADFRALVDAVHARGMKLYMDIIVNHTADVIAPVECSGHDSCPYRSRADYPYQRKGGVTGTPINPGFAGDQVMTADNFARLTDTDYAYTVRVPPAKAHLKVPEWLNDPHFYHNRGDSTFRGESSQLGDFVGLDDLMTEHPRVVQGMIDIYGKWIDDYGVDGFRIDTAQHVNPEFWQAFVPAILARARARGIPNFHIFGEVAMGEMDPAHTAVNTQVDGLPSVLDFAFAFGVIDVVANGAPPAELAKLFRADPLYHGGAAAALQLPTFIGNHDAGRFAMFLRKGSPKADGDEQLARDELAHAMLLTLRGVPTIYYGDEQGFAGAGGDQDSRQDMFGSKVASFNDGALVGSGATTATPRFDADHPLYRAIANLARLRVATPALRRGLQRIRFAAEEPGLFAVSRFDPDNGREVLLLFNTSTHAITQNVEVNVASQHFSALAGQCSPTAVAPGSVAVALAPLGYAVCAAQ